MLLFAGMAGLLATWNAARPLIDPTRRYSPSWLPAMLVTELAPFWLIVHGGALTIGLWFGGWDDWSGRIGTVMVALSMVILLWIIMRTFLAVRKLRRLIHGPVHGATGWARLIGLPVPTPQGVTESRAIEWHDGLTLDLTRPTVSDRRLPVMVYVHGGGWTGGDPQRQARDLYHALALDGWAVASIRYPFTPGVSVEQQIEVVAAAVRWVRTELDGIEPSHVVLAGGSAGAHLAAMAALTAENASAAVDALVGMYGVYDMANRNRMRAPWAKIRNEVMLASVSEAPERYRAVSPIDHITPRTPPVLLVHGTNDTLVPIGEAEQFARALMAAGRSVELVPVDGAQHAFDAVSSPTSRTVAALTRTWLRRTVLER